MRNFPVAASLALLAALLPCSASAAENGAALFENFCAPCHGLDGKARTPAGKKLGAKDLRESRLADEAIEKQIREGSKDKRGTEKMPPFQEKLSAEGVGALVAYVKTFRSR